MPEQMIPCVQVPVSILLVVNRLLLQEYGQEKVLKAVREPNYFDPNAQGVFQGGMYKLVYTFTDNIGCYNSDTMKMNLFNTPTPDAGTYDDACIGQEPIVLNGQPIGGKWTGQGVSQDTFYPSIGLGTFEIVYTVTSTGGLCPKFDKTTISVHPSPTVLFDADPKEGKKPLNVQFYQLSWINGGTITDYAWDFGDGNQGDKSGNFNYVFDDAGTFSVKLKVTSDKGCEAEMIKNNLIKVTDNVGLEDVLSAYDLILAPNPAKDKSYLHFNNTAISGLVIYNIYGQLVYESYENQISNPLEIRQSETGKGLFLVRVVPEKRRSARYEITL